MKKLDGLKISLCQMKVVPGRPDINCQFIIREIASAKKRGIDIIVFPEMCTTGYLIGDKFEEDSFIDDVLRRNKEIVDATSIGITAIFGTVSRTNAKGEDGRPRIHNSAVIAAGGQILSINIKSLQPNYRIFNDDKHFYSLRKIAEEQDQLYRQSDGRTGRLCANLNDYLNPIPIKSSVGIVKIGVILCEDMWHQDYAFNPTKTLARKGANLIFNISASPWTWQKNRKRHQVVKDLLSECHVPFVYVNNTGAQNTGKNIIVFDGSSTIYNENGEILLEVDPYVDESMDFEFTPDANPVDKRELDDTRELYAAMVCATKSMAPDGVNVFVGLSGGIDSATTAAHLVDVLGKSRVTAINMPMGNLNSAKTQRIAREVAKNLGIKYEVIPITEIVEAISKATGVMPSTLAYENVQARARMEILAAYAQKTGAYFVCNSNKVEVAFGYGTMYGDIAGFYAPLGDLVKREVRLIANHLNNSRFRRKIIPMECINQTPTAELSKGQKDPFDYGDLNRRGYHDEMVRAYTEFRRNPEWILEMYINGTLETHLKLETGTLKALFPNTVDFVEDLKHWWIKFQNSFFKRVQCPPIPIFSKRAFGRDIEESLMTPFFSQKFLTLEKAVISPSRIVVFGSGCNPPAIHHRIICETISRECDLLIITPSGIRKDKPESAFIENSHRKIMTLLTFGDLGNAMFDLSDLDENVFTPTHLLYEKYRKQFPLAEIFFLVGGDLIRGGRSGNSEIQKSWVKGQEIWNGLNYILISHPDCNIDPGDAPPHSEILSVRNLKGRSTLIRERVLENQPISDLVMPEVEEYILCKKLYK